MLAENKFCRRCELRQLCSRVVTGIGPHDAKLMIVGEYPNNESDLQGEPFMGREGDYLKKALSQSGIDYKNTYATSVIKCSPQSARMIESAHINTCKPWLWEEIKTINPINILTLGAMPNKLLMKKKTIKMNELIENAPHKVEYMSPNIYPYFSLHYLLQRNPYEFDKFVKYLERLK